MSAEFSKRDQSILFGLFLSKFSEMAVRALGCESYTEAFNKIGYAIGCKPASIKNYRDEFDPYFPNPRKGWHNRPLREYCYSLYEEFKLLSFSEFTILMKSLISPDYEIEEFFERLSPSNESDASAKRQLTGVAAEGYFRSSFQSIYPFKGFSLTDTTNHACGFDFKLDRREEYFCVEVKGLNADKGSVLLTEKEYQTAKLLRDSYCLFIVSNFISKPSHQCIFNPVDSHLSFKETKRQVIQTSYWTSI